MAHASALAVFSRLPYEVWERIWECFAHVSTDTNYDDLISPKHPKTDMRILRNSWYICEEVKELSTRGATCNCAHRTITTHWIWIRLRKIGWSSLTPLGIVNPGRGYVGAKWLAKCLGSFILPDPGRKGDFCVWKRLVDLVGLTKGWGITKQLIIRLGKIGEVKWWDTEGRNGNSPEIIDKDAIMLPFCSLLNVKSLRIETYSKEFTAVIYSSQTICREILNVGNRINNHTNSNEKITEGVGPRLVPQAQ
ncbi:uncharacterized protein BDW43DRAFT_310658 [Aspergillus alliaceus]|uniref:uncharacterized protein n=1 Tax=Petromyces alliaceus TaxID=209559 RepID=UPI0012A4D557|nr:uncharacterized protein BDW43DRAFT_310658 [Aspergillus alliaceus]KAB8233984.1 hypothetical protein BDW43DRAFT_310658 [Aspergillus alliaceus]